MTFKIEAVTVLPAVVLLVLSGYLSFIALRIADPRWTNALLIVGLGCFFGGIVFSLSWFYYWAIRKGMHE